MAAHTTRTHAPTYLPPSMPSLLEAFIPKLEDAWTQLMFSESVPHCSVGCMLSLTWQEMAIAPRSHRKRNKRGKQIDLHDEFLRVTSSPNVHIADVLPQYSLKYPRETCPRQLPSLMCEFGNICINETYAALKYRNPRTYGQKYINSISQDRKKFLDLNQTHY